MLIRALAMGGVIAIVLCAFGAQFTYVALRDGKQLEISCADYIARRPDAHWLKLTDCEYDFEHLAYEEDETGSKYTHIYLPLHPAGDSSGLTSIIVKRGDRATLDVVWQLEHGNGAYRPPGLDRLMTDLAKPTEGLVEFGLSLSDKERADLNRLGLPVTKNFVLVDDARQPQLAAGLIMLLLGLSGVAVLGVLIVRQLRRPKTPPHKPPVYWPPSNPMNPGFPPSPIASFERKI